jgi:hypothetical protein
MRKYLSKIQFSPTTLVIDLRKKVCPLLLGSERSVLKVDVDYALIVWFWLHYFNQNACGMCVSLYVYTTISDTRLWSQPTGREQRRTNTCCSDNVSSLIQSAEIVLQCLRHHGVLVFSLQNCVCNAIGTPRLPPILLWNTLFQSTFSRHISNNMSSAWKISEGISSSDKHVSGYTVIRKLLKYTFSIQWQIKENIPKLSLDTQDCSSVILLSQSMTYTLKIFQAEYF